jgi:hypothetical protein
MLGHEEGNVRSKKQERLDAVLASVGPVLLADDDEALGSMLKKPQANIGVPSASRRTQSA